MNPSQPVKQPWYIIVLLILAGEAVFILPFVLARVFRPTFLAAFELDNVSLGICFSTYGIVALISYLFGGVLADRFKPAKLMAVALWLTAAGGVFMATFPDYFLMKILYGYWGFTTIFLFWAAMIKATRIWGGVSSQGKAFGFLDGGRGLVGAAFGTLGVFIFSLFIDANATETSPELREEAFGYVILVSSAIVALIGIFVFFFLKFRHEDEVVPLKETISAEDIKTVISMPVIWLLMIIILCAYVGYKTTDVFSLYAREVMLFSEVDSAKTGTFLLYMRPLVGVLVGFLADRAKASVYLIVGFLLSIAGAVIFASGLLGPDHALTFFFSIIIIAMGVYAARVLYFAVFNEGNIPLLLMGTAVGVVSFIGYTPDIFAGPMIGYFLDEYPGEPGQQYVFWILAGFSFIGLIASLLFYRITNRKTT
ncbi:MFS transporter [Pukyongia salina]|uniref:MFS transporter n=1 Tax=Pukyongia salina TaxID=2094025 RepID=A0A2S0HYA1_9FLAO|nr:MFS transporter [Pukyongia salina]AVI51632.1 MFS transporter [Pukyongia salina]